MPDARPLGEPIDWTPARIPERTPLRGAHVELQPLDARAHAESLFEAGRDPEIWTYLPYGPFERVEQMRPYLEWAAAQADPVFFAVVVDGRPMGVASYLRITPEHGVVEIGHIWFGTGLQRTTAATEAIYLLARHAFEALGYRRLEWKCNALNAASRRAAERFGFRFEGVFRKHFVMKGRSRDTAWFAITDDEWPALAAGYRAWLDPANFDEQGRQRTPLSYDRG